MRPLHLSFLTRGKPKSLKTTPRVRQLSTIGYKSFRRTPNLIYSNCRSNMSGDAEPHAIEVSYPEEGITVITINREKRRNAVNTATANKLYNAIIAYEEDPKAKVAILRGANGTFCAGYDLHTIGDPDNSATLSSNSPSLDANERSQGAGGLGAS